MNGHPDQPAIGSPSVEPPLLAGLIRGELVEWTKQMQGAFDAMNCMRADGSASDSPAEQWVYDKAVNLAASLIGKMEMLACLAETYGEWSAGEHERFFISSLLSEILEARPDTRWPRFALKPHGPDVAPIYGNKRWLRTLLLHLLRELESNLGATQKINFSVKQLGNHILLVCNDEMLLPQDRNQPPPPLPPETGLTFSSCRRIAEIHGGAVRLNIDEENGQKVLTGFILSLPTSTEELVAVRRCDDCPLVEQIERYASDLAAVLDRCEKLEGESAHG